MALRNRRVAALALALVVASACSSAPTKTAVPSDSGSGAAAAAATKAPAATAKPFTPVGTFAIAPRHALPGTTVTATGSGLAMAKDYDIVWTTVDGTWKLSDDKTLIKGRTFAEQRQTIARVKTDGAGAFSTTFVVPAGFGFGHDVLVTSGAEVVNKTLFDVDMDLKVSPTSGPAGTPITLDLAGIGTRPLQNSWLVLYDNTFTGWLSGVTTHGAAKATIPAVGRPGTHIITVIHGSFGSAYLNPQDSPQPDRPVWRIPFTVTAGAAVLPTAATTQTVPDATIAMPAQGSFFAEPARGVVGSKTTLRGSGLTPNADVQLVWVNAGGTDAVAGTRPDSEVPIATAKTDANGSFAAAYTIPDEAGGAHRIEARIGGTKAATTLFAIQPSVQPLAVTRGPSGTPFTIQLNGVYTTDTGKIYHLVYDNAFSGYVCSFNTGGNIKINFRASGDAGWHFIDLYPGLYDTEEKAPINYRMPQLTAAADHPGETMPIFHLAFEITEP